MNSTSTLMNARWHQARGSAKETWGRISGQKGTRLEGQIERLSALGQERLLLTEAQARGEIERARQKGQQDIQLVSASLADIANQALRKPAKPAKKGSAWIWIPAVGGVALLAGLGVAMFTQNGPLHGVLQNQDWWVQNQDWWHKLPSPAMRLKRR